MNQKELISVIVPVYNVEAYLPRCLESIAAQTYRNLEVILVDDGSTDSSGKICDEFCRKDERFRVIHQENQWLSGARNTGLKNVTGEYIYFLDSDDYIHVKAIETLYNAISEGYDLAVMETVMVESLDENIYIERERKKAGYQVFDKDYCMRTLLFTYNHDNLIIGVAWNKLYPRKIIEGLWFNSLYGIEDQDFNIRVYLRVDKVIFTNEPFHYYLQRQDSIVHNSKVAKRDFISLLAIRGMVSYTQRGSKYRGWTLKKLFRRLLIARYRLYRTEYEKEAAGVSRSVLKEQLGEYLFQKHIGIREKLMFLVLWYCPWLMRMLMKVTGNGY